MNHCRILFAFLAQNVSLWALENPSRVLEQIEANRTAKPLRFVVGVISVRVTTKKKEYLKKIIFLKLGKLLTPRPHG